MTKSKVQPLLARAADEARLLNEFWLIAMADAYRRNLLKQVTGLNGSEVIDWYFCYRLADCKAWVEAHTFEHRAAELQRAAA